MNRLRILISGGGIAGLTLGICLQRVGVDVTIVEKAPAPRSEGYMMDFYGPGYAVADALGLLCDLARIHYEIPTLVFLDRHGVERVSLRYAALRRRLFRNRHYNFMRGDLERVLFERLRRSSEIRYGTEIESLNEEKGSLLVTLSTGSTETWDLVVGADGIHSNVRRLVFPENLERYLGYATAAFTIDDPPASLSPSFVTITEPSRQVSVYPINGSRLAAFFLHRRDKPVTDSSRGAAVRELRSSYAGMRWIVPDLLSHLDSARDIYFDSVSQVETSRWSKGRVVLIGDAAGCVSLLAGQGASLAMAGAYVLARELARLPVDRALAAYESRMRPRVERTQRSGRSIARWFLPETDWRIRMRNLGLRLSTTAVGAYFYRRGLVANEAGSVE